MLIFHPEGGLEEQTGAVGSSNSPTKAISSQSAEPAVLVDSVDEKNLAFFPLWVFLFPPHRLYVSRNPSSGMGISYYLLRVKRWMLFVPFDLRHKEAVHGPNTLVVKHLVNHSYLLTSCCSNVVKSSSISVEYDKKRLDNPACITGWGPERTPPR